MFNNKNIKKLVSIICTILTLNNVASILPHQANAIQITTKYVENPGFEQIVVKFDKPFHCIIIQQDTKRQNYIDIYKSYYKESLLYIQEVDRDSPFAFTTIIVPKSQPKVLTDYLSTTNENDDIMLVMGLIDKKELKEFPNLPYCQLAMFKPEEPDILTLINENKQHSLIQHLTKTISGQSKILIKAMHRDLSFGEEKYLYQLGSPTTKHDTDLSTDDYNDYLQQPGTIMTVGELKEWIRDNNQELAEKLGLLANPKNQTEIKKNDSEKKTAEKSIIMEAETIPETNQPAVKPTQSKDPSVPTFNTEKQLELVINKAAPNTATKQTQNEDCPKELHTDNSDHRNCEKSTKRNILCNTKKFIKKNPKTSVGLGTAIVTLVGTIIYNIKKLFTRESTKSQIKHQVHHKRNQYVNNKI